MTSQRPTGDAVQKTISTRTVAGSVLVLLAAAGIGLAVREFRFRSYRKKHPAQTAKAVQPRDISKTAIKQAPEEPEIQDVQEQLPVEEVVVEPEPLVPEPASPPATSIMDADGQSDTEAPAQTPEAPFDQEPSFNEPAIKERRGRVALAYIGHNPEADEVWIRIINDPSVSANARSNLIEDLNEDGLSYRNLTLDDLPMILYRIELIEELRPYAMDKVNADAFDEAHKDLVNMANRLTQR
ncbi:MAG: hypothetical protein JSW66_08875 [Phycisphaerales bacterium]|nr:MAG: hypothetical protein JSW66_08875 [Phycisphaerales bacterium]